MDNPVDEKWKTLRLHFDRYLKNDPQATHALFTELTRILKAFYALRTQSRTQSEDLTQAALLKIHFARDRFDAAQSLKTWVFTIAGRTLIDHWRGSRPEDLAIPEDDENTTIDGALRNAGSDKIEFNPALRTEMQNDLQKALGELKPTDRMIVYLYAIEGFSMAEISASLNLTESAVKVRAHRGYEKMRKVLNAQSITWIGLFWARRYWE